MQLTVNRELITVVPKTCVVRNRKYDGEAKIEMIVNTGMSELSVYQQECIARHVKQLLMEKFHE